MVWVHLPKIHVLRPTPKVGVLGSEITTVGVLLMGFKLLSKGYPSLMCEDAARRC